MERAPSRPLLKTTRDVAQPSQFAFWESCSSLVELEKPPASRAPGFAAEETTWRLGTMALMVAQVAACRYRRSPLRTRRDGLDHWTISVAMQGSRRLRSGDRAVLMRPGTAWLGSLAVPYEVDRTESAWLHLFIPRDDLPRLCDLAEPGQPIPLNAPAGRVLHDYLLMLARQLPGLGHAEAAQMGEATKSIIAASLLHALDRGVPASPALHEAQRAHLRRLIRENLHRVTLGPERLSRLAGISRTQLYRLFDEVGGVAALIRAERLRAARRALGNPMDTRSIAEIAAGVGLCDPSSFGRMFRREFGCTPSELRLAMGTGPDRLRVQAGDELGTVTDLLRSL